MGPCSSIDLSVVSFFRTQISDCAIAASKATFGAFVRRLFDIEDFKLHIVLVSSQELQPASIVTYGTCVPRDAVDQVRRDFSLEGVVARRDRDSAVQSVAVHEYRDWAGEAYAAEVQSRYVGLISHAFHMPHAAWDGFATP